MMAKFQAQVLFSSKKKQKKVNRKNLKTSQLL